MAKKRIYRFKGSEGGRIAESDARKWIQNHQDHHDVKGHFYGKEILQRLLNQPGCVGIRIYHAINDKGAKQLVLIGADSKGKDMWQTAKSTKSKTLGTEGGGEGAIDTAMPCPPFCS